MFDALFAIDAMVGDQALSREGVGASKLFEAG